MAESTLGKLAKWLRLAGFDTLCHTGTPDYEALKIQAMAQKRMVLTRTGPVFTKLPSGRAIFIESDDPGEQIRQVFKNCNIHRDDLAPLSRCSVCNSTLRQIPKEKLQGAVPDYILLRHQRFHECPECRRIHWAGTHVTGMMAMIERWFP